MKYIYLLLFLVFTSVGFIFALLNSAAVSINYYYGWLDIPLSFVIVSTFIVGILIGMLSKVWANAKLRRQYSQLAKQASLSKQDLSQRNTSPLKSLN